MRDIEQAALQALDSVDYSGGQSPLEAICERQSRKTGLDVQHLPPASENGWSPGILGRLQFEPLKIILFSGSDHHFHRQRFTLAHELGHLFLGHSKYLRQEYFEEADCDLLVGSSSTDDNIRRMEWQANHFASCLLLPAVPFLEDFEALAKEYDLRDRGFGLLYLDDQPCNQSVYYGVTDRLVRAYKVSRTVVRVRLENLQLLRDARSVKSHLGD